MARVFKSLVQSAFENILTANALISFFKFCKKHYFFYVDINKKGISKIREKFIKKY